jgi:hypothetical protein
VQATTHPFHYDSICLNGLGCDIATPAGDRSLADFFAIGFNAKTNKLSVVFDRTNKKPDEAQGHVASVMVAHAERRPVERWRDDQWPPDRCRLGFRPDGRRPVELLAHGAWSAASARADAERVGRRLHERGDHAGCR